MRPTIHRRAFLVACAAVPFAGACARLSFVSGRLDADRIVVAKSDLAAEQYALVEVPLLDFPIYLHRQGVDAYSAVLTRCGHRGCTVEPEGGRLVCPCHGSEYTHLGAILKGPTERPLIRFEVATDSEYIYILDVARAAVAR